MDETHYEFLLNSSDLFDFESSRADLNSYREPPRASPVGSPACREYMLSHAYPYRRRMAARDYYAQKLALQIELVKMQNWVKDTGTKLVLLFEGRDAAGKGSTIQRFLEHLNPRGANVVALEKPTEDEQGQWYFQRYVRRLASRGEIVLFDRSWYNRAGVERVMGFCTDAEHEEFMRQVPAFERMLVGDGTILIKFYLSVSKEEQARRFAERENNPLKRWKLSPIDEQAQERWDEYSEAKDVMMERTDSEEAPWILIKSDDKLRARLEAMRYVLDVLDYEGKDAIRVKQPDPWILTQASRIYPRP